MKWFDKWFYRKARWAWARGGYENPDWKYHEDLLDQVAEEQEFQQNGLSPGHEKLESSEVIGGDPHGLNDGLRIDVKKLNGGFIVTFRHPLDPKSPYGEDKRNSYIIQEDDDFNERLGKLLTMELMR